MRFSNTTVTITRFGWIAHWPVCRRTTRPTLPPGAALSIRVPPSAPPSLRPSVLPTAGAGGHHTTHTAGSDNPGLRDEWVAQLCISITLFKTNADRAHHIFPRESNQGANGEDPSQCFTVKYSFRSFCAQRVLSASPPSERHPPAGAPCAASCPLVRPRCRCH